MTSAPLDTAALRARLVAPHGPYAALDVVASTGSTNSDLAEAAGAGAADRTVLIAERQTAGRGRMHRTWVSEQGAGLYLSVLLRPEGVPPARLGWLPLLAGVVLVDLARDTAGVPAAVKWPNDLLAGEHRAKCAGVLAEVVGGPAAVLGVGLNVNQRPEDLPSGAGGLPATSLAAEGAARTDRTELAIALLTGLAAWESRWREHAGDPVASGLLDAYRRVCGTLGEQVRVQLPAGGEVLGAAQDVDEEGRLLVRSGSGAIIPVSAGDVVHVRPVG
ncbi:biotin--[acetyl-CoA-carboxylase] ligase [Gandjariella thermophila]|uniref:biotin--[biotin carboxyl-carrier protein] ligase n=1 Tax=Gandjariella thermophila TaxID=1931992 RepID=A0A4D4JAC6_9PSEU|nr:biotin--[acetyl-CoA-carboxylase] ligase [Gandjariella thermophila]GDY31359.1 biotin--[acetyl-CoA-carboxylase] ligase [Gandjariella thermophila]